MVVERLLDFYADLWQAVGFAQQRGGEQRANEFLISTRGWTKEAAANRKKKPRVVWQRGPVAYCKVLLRREESPALVPGRKQGGGPILLLV